jgi:5-methylcytosine-specific restriction protein A
MALKDITSRQAVLDAIAECDRLGQDVFLERYGFHRAREYYLVHDGREYDSKAIAGVAHKYQFPNEGPLASGNFGGGDKTVRPLLESLGFEVRIRKPR